MKNIGLKRHTVKLTTHQESWAEIFQDSKAELSNLLSPYALHIEHIGSTSIRGILSKPIIDIVIAVESMVVINNIISILESNGYEYRGDGGREGGQFFVRNSEPEVRTHHIHIVESGDDQWDNFIHFRDRLNADEKLAKKYSNLKEDLAILYPDNRGLYSKGKNDFIQKIINFKNP